MLARKRKINNEELVLNKILNNALKNVPMEIQKEVDKFISSIKNIRYFIPDGNPNPEWKVYYGKTWMEARTVANRAAFDLGDISWDIGRQNQTAVALKRSEDIAVYSKRELAWHAATNATWSEAFKIIMDRKLGLANIDMDGAAKAASLSAGLMVVKDLDFYKKGEYTKYANSVMEIYEKGYGLLGAINGVFYVYCKDEQPAKMSLNSELRAQ